MVKPINLTDDEPLILNKSEVADDEIKININEKIDPDNEQEAKNFIQSMMAYMTNKDFDKKIVEKAQQSGLDKRVIANNFAAKILGKISDILHVAIDTVGDVFATLISILAGLLIKGGELICRVAKRLISIVTFNYTCI